MTRTDRATWSGDVYQRLLQRRIRQVARVPDAALEASLPLIRNAKGPVFLNIKIHAQVPLLILPPRQGVLPKNRLRQALLGAEE